MTLRITALADPEETASGRRLAWLASDPDGDPVGRASLRLFTKEGQRHLAELDIQVQPSGRRRQAGSLLLDAALAAAREDGRRSVVAQADADSPGAAFLTARDFRPALALTYARLPLAAVDLAALTEVAEAPHADYRLTAWEGTVPDALAATFVASRRAMDDMPMGTVDHGTVLWDLDRVRAAAAAVAARGDLLHTVAAVDRSDGSVVGFTELVIPGSGTGDAQHYGTAVLPEHRGHGLARRMKAASILRARTHHPRLDGLLTDTADNNPHMRRVNDELGYVPTHTAHEYQRAL
ncbi:GNAT family N-acetyltransferase [Streptomyces spectabilis]|uniref:GNAT family N-acetyltransferase n=1 Tax=Streptomyces spectabilis TaxID=68270 RepID=A0A5P2XAX7_STRST|nr:GNAT family N-acetyltransferase [Streptomyces spectabilis]MBB5104122.1 GNAT superfamily N-acetyltransferase [Streptomyces spectabilis]MCI3903648.1 GNAT family N-acetyltransferase [Streptomyces spectabilis]QEV60834.1 GNAT family N-acetyltransferase [Streptomyces spectabilis]GGV39646.1 N-acetyltransferase [Streptomyces spectabilis]